MTYVDDEALAWEELLKVGMRTPLSASGPRSVTLSHRLRKISDREFVLVVASDDQSGAEPTYGSTTAALSRKKVEFH